jgi:hypothetical protein
MASDLKGRPNKGVQQPRNSGGKEDGILPFVSITPIAKGDAQVDPGRRKDRRNSLEFSWETIWELN